MKKIIVGLMLVLFLSSCGFLDKIYEGQNEKVRDSSRIMDLKALQAQIEMFYQDSNGYPKSLSELSNIPKDIKDGKIINGCKFGYKYEVFEDENGISNENYILSTCLENKDNIEKEAKNDGGIYDDRYEVFNFKGTKEEVLKRIKKNKVSNNKKNNNIIEEVSENKSFRIEKNPEEKKLEKKQKEEKLSREEIIKRIKEKILAKKNKKLNQVQEK